MLLHSTGTGTGVNITTLNPLLKADLSFVARPELTATTVNNSQSAPAGTGSAGAPAATTGDTTGASGDDANPGISADTSGAQQAQDGQQQAGTETLLYTWFQRHSPGNYTTVTATATATTKFRSWVFYG
ncbi:hypothetical protein [Actinomyces ruminis]|uniref:Uncharacterized protein n=1 Tax=Actinomyces ruminis TaxID=1937003 RepID=A0ABX4MBS6_9ACTO|nr:hypothetical protein [Actinomyces ruminis]PHP52868.1 hypothetical protein BW737_006220 [Actinomyces ruminis]